VQSVHIATKYMSWNPIHVEMYSMQHFLFDKVDSDLRQVGGFHRIFRENGKYITNKFYNMENIYFDIGFPSVSTLLLETKKEVVSDILMNQ
jgi:hypothetical protein